MVHAKEAGFAERLRKHGLLGVFKNLPFALPGASGCFLLPSGRRVLFAGQPTVPKTWAAQKERDPKAPFFSRRLLRLVKVLRGNHGIKHGD